MASPLYDIDTMLIPELIQLKQEVMRSFNMGNNIRVYSGLAAETTNDIKVYADQIQDEIDSRQINDNV